MWKELLERKKRKRDIDGGRVPLRIPVEKNFPKKQKKKTNNNKTNNELDIDINKKFIIDFDIDKEGRDG